MLLYTWHNKRAVLGLVIGIILGSFTTYIFQTSITCNYSQITFRANSPNSDAIVKPVVSDDLRNNNLHVDQNFKAEYSSTEKLQDDNDDEDVDINSLFVHNITSHQDVHAGEDELAKYLYNEIRIACFILTHPKQHESHAQNVLMTWAKRCNIFYIVSTEPVNSSIPTVIYNGKESRDILWGKTKLGFTHAYNHYFDDADWFVKADDDTYLIMENLRYLLLDKDPATAVYYGCKYKVIVEKGYMSGGAGYVLSKEALRRFVEESLPHQDLCRQDDGGAEDVEIGYCLTRVGVEVGDSRDDERLPRFFPFVPYDHIIKPPWDNSDFWYWKNIWYTHEQSVECCSDSVIGFHYMDKNLMWTLEYFIYHVHPFGIDPKLTGSKIKNKIIKYLKQRPLKVIKKMNNGANKNLTGH